MPLVFGQIHLDMDGLTLTSWPLLEINNEHSYVAAYHQNRRKSVKIVIHLWITCDHGQSCFFHQTLGVMRKQLF